MSLRNIVKVILVCLLCLVGSSNLIGSSTVSLSKIVSSKITSRSHSIHYLKQKDASPKTTNSLSPSTSTSVKDQGQNIGSTRATSTTVLQNGNGQSAAINYVGSTSGYVSDVTCPTNFECYAVGQTAALRSPFIMKSLNDGNSWENLNFPTGVTKLNSIACITIDDCVAVGTGYLGFAGLIVVTQDGGQSWTIAYLGGSDFTSVTCYGTTICMALEQQFNYGSSLVFISSNLFSTFSAENFSQVFSQGTTVCTGSGSCLGIIENGQCFSASFCVINGLLAGSNGSSIQRFAFTLFTTTGGESWKYIAAPNGVYAVSSVSCFASFNCFASGLTVSATPVVYQMIYNLSSDSWSTTNAYYLPTQIASINGLYCFSTSECFGVGASSLDIPEVFSTNNLGLSWSIASISSEIPSLSLMDCYGVDLSGCLIAGTTQDLSSTVFYSITLNSILGQSYYPVTSGVTISAINKGILTVGDSVSIDLGIGMAVIGSGFNISVNVSGIVGCGIIALPTMVNAGQTDSNPPSCLNWQQSYQNSINSNPNDTLAVLEVGRWDAATWIMNGQQVGFGDVGFDQYYETSLESAISILSSTGAHVIVLNSPYYNIGTQLDGTPWRTDSNQRVDIMNQLDQSVVNNSSGKASLINFNSFICPQGTFQQVVNGITIRDPDGIHLTLAGEIYTDYWLLSQIAANF